MELIFAIAVVVTLVVFGRRIGAQNNRIQLLEAQVRLLDTEAGKSPRSPAAVSAWAGTASAEAPAAFSPPAEPALAPPPPAAPEAVEAAEPAISPPPVPEIEPETQPIPPAHAPGPRPQPIDWERTLGVRLPVWGGAVMLLIAGFFLINWAIEAGIASIFTPEVRVVLCALAAGGLLAAAFVVKRRGIANGDRIASALATSAIAVGYGTVFLAASVFNLVPGVAALVGASLITALAILVALRFDRRVMLVGLLGGYLSPLFVWVVGTSGGLVPYYVAVLLAVSLFVIRRFGWWTHAIPALVGPVLWACALMLWTDPVTLVAFYLSLAAIPLLVSRLPMGEPQASVPKRQDVVLWCTAIAAALLSLAALPHHFDVAFAVGQILLSGMAVALLAFDPDKQPGTWGVTLVSSLFLLVVWMDADPATLLATTLVLAALHLGALVLQFRAGQERAAHAFEIAGLSAVFFLILLVKLDGWIGARDVPYVWAAIAFAIAAAFAWLLVGRRDAEGKPDPLAGFAVGASAFLSLGLGLVLDPGLYALVAALQAFGLALIYWKFRLPVLKALHVAYVVLYGLLLAIGQVASVLAGLFYAYRSAGAFQFIPVARIADHPVTLLLLPGVLLLGAATAFNRVAYSTLPRTLDVVGVALVACATHFLILPYMPADFYRQAFTTGAVWVNVMLLLALAASLAGDRLDRPYLAYAGMGLSIVVGFAMLVWQILPVFQFWPTIDTPGPPVFNVALLALGLPAVMMLASAQLSRRIGVLPVARGLAAFGGIAGLVMILVLIRQAVHGPSLNGSGAVSGQVELYLYSGGMLLYGFALLWGGAVASSIALRAGSLLVVLAAIGKVFLYDVSGLEGLWRVGSFLGMGIALLVVSWFYGRFVFGIGPSGKPRGEALGEVRPAP